MRSYVKMFEAFSIPSRAKGKTEEDLIQWILENERVTVVLIPVMADGRIVGFYDRIIESEQALTDAIIKENVDEIAHRFQEEIDRRGSLQEFLRSLTHEDLGKEGYSGGIAFLRIKTGEVGLWWAASDRGGKAFDPTVYVEEIVPDGISGIISRLRGLPPEEVPAAMARMKRGRSAFGM